MAHWWGVGLFTVWQWRRALGVGATTRGASRLRTEYTSEPWAVEAWARRYDAATEPVRRAKIAAARRGKPRPRVIEAMREASLGSHHSEDTRRRMSEAHKKRGTRPPAAGRPWTLEEDAQLGTMPDADAARRTGRSEEAVQERRAALGIDGFYRKRRRLGIPRPAGLCGRGTDAR